jgi:hypothetical protein
MGSRAVVSASIATLLMASFTALAFAGCGSSDAGPAPHGADASADASGDAAAALDATGASDGSGLPDGIAPPQGTHLLATTGAFKVNGVTVDGFVIYTDVVAGTVNALPVGGGSPVTISPVDDADTVFVDGGVVFVMPTVDQATQTGPLTVWTSASGASPIATKTFAFDGAIRVSPTGTHVVFLDGLDANGDVGDVYLVGVDGSKKTKLVPGVGIAACFPRVGFAGAYAVVQFCAAPPTLDGGAGDDGGSDASDADASADGGGVSSATAAHLQSYLTTTGTRVLDTDVLADDGFDLSTNDATMRVLAHTTDGLTVFGADGTFAATLLDADGVAGVFTADGASVVYVTATNALKRTTVTTPSPITLQASAAALLGLSPDESSVLTFRAQDPTTGNFDLYVSSSSASAAATTLTASTEANLFGDAFTADSSRVLYYTSIDPDTMAGTLDVSAVTGGAPTAIGTSVWIDTALTGTKVVFDDNDADQVTGDLEIVDVATGAKPTLLVSQVDQDFYVTAAKDKIVYGWSLVAGPYAGVWVMDVP